ncbi:thermonuclease family protein [Pelagovum pacificum]|uniref:Thermonuclease family protein n=1 Tax=Pelagovum pacificum TaxID=2588711 RepID=A0A5C5G9Z9_9RHOB|nr:thermonuclease family protein [Pelagovum pacificum]QQA41509.1 thermonuclease family protein [Pelagovum pacificum]TNY30790.1 thermonuclease family protein [Pelagovum pacificum]
MLKPFLLVLLSIVPAALTAQASLEGVVTHVRDVDTFEVDGIAIRLNGIDGPELNEPHGRQASAFMQQLVDGRTVTCALNGERNGDRLIGVCFLDGQDVGALAIAQGLALDCRRYSGGRYAHLEQPGAVQRLGGRAGYC